MDYCNNFRYDLKVGQVGEKLLNDILTLKTIEVKRDSWIYKSGNIAIEFESRSKPSGIAKSEAEYWAIIFSGDYKDEIILIIKSNRLKEICRIYYKKGNIKEMGDNNTSKAILIPIKEILQLITK
jgi:hypothetical protein